MIPAEAVEAAAKAYRREFPYDENEGYVVKLILEAAAPHMVVEAWDAAIQDADDEGYLYTHQSDYMKNRNPYRPTP